MAIANQSGDHDLEDQLKPHGNGGNTAQGFYIVSASGTFLGWINEHQPKQVLAFLEKGLAAYRNRPPDAVQISPSAANAPFSVTPDPSTSVVRVFTRIRPVPPGADDLNNGLGRDHLWILADEVKAIEDASHNDGKSFALPPSMTARIVRFHLVDNVRGEPDMWEKKEVKDSTFSARLIKNSGSTKTYEMHGAFKDQTANNKRGIEGTLEGQFEIATAVEKISHFRAFGQANAWGASTFTPGVPPGTFHMVMAMVDADDSITKVVPPQAMYADWQEGYLHPER
jgi:hypothetical protein